MLGAYTGGLWFVVLLPIVLITIALVEHQLETRRREQQHKKENPTLDEFDGGD